MVTILLIRSYLTVLESTYPEILLFTEARSAQIDNTQEQDRLQRDWEESFATYVDSFATKPTPGLQPSIKAEWFEEELEALKLEVIANPTRRDTATYLSNAFEQKGDIDGSIEFWKTIVASHGGSVPLEQLVKAFAVKGDNPGLIALLKELLLKCPTRLLGRQLGEALKVSGDHRGALEFWKMALTLRPGDIVFAGLLTQAFKTADDYDGALKFWSEFKSHYAKNSATAETIAYLQMAEILWEMGEVTSSVGILKSLARNGLLDSTVGYLADTVATICDCARAIEILQQFKNYSPKVACYVTRLQRRCQARGDFKGAAEIMTAAITQFKHEGISSAAEITSVFKKMGDIDGAVTFWRNVTERYPASMEAINQFANALHINGDLNTMLNVCKTALRSNVNIKMARQVREEYQRRQDLDGEIDFWESMRSENVEGGPVVVKMLMDALQLRGDDNRIIQISREELLKHSVLKQSWLHITLAACKKFKRIDTAIELWKCLTKMEPKDATIMDQLVDLGKRTGNYAVMLDIISANLSYFAGDEQMAERFKNVKSADQAVRLWERELQRDPENLKETNNPAYLVKIQRITDQLAYAMRMKGDIDGEIRVLSTAYLSAMRLSEARFYEKRLREVFERGGNARAAIEFWKECWAHVRSRPDHFCHEGTINALEDAFRQNGRVEESIDWWKSQVLQHPTNDNIARCLSAAFREKNDVDSTIEFWMNAFYMNPRSEGLASRLAESLEEQGNIDAAIDAWKVAVMENPNQSMCGWMLTKAFEKKGNVDDAVELLVMARLTYPENKCLVEQLRNAKKIQRELQKLRTVV